MFRNALALMTLAAGLACAQPSSAEAEAGKQAGAGKQLRITPFPTCLELQGGTPDM